MMVGQNKSPEEAQFKRCASLIKNWKAMEGVDWDFQNVQIDGLLVDKQPDENNEKWEISLLTTMYSQITDDGRYKYAVRWGFRDLWGNLAFFSLKGYALIGELFLNYIDYDDFAIVGFSVVNDGSPIFKFNEPDEITILSVDKIAHQTLMEIFPEDDEGIDD